MRTRIASASAYLAIAASVASWTSADSSYAALGDCGQPVSSGLKPSATDALAVLRAAVGGPQCDAKPCVCDVNGNGSMNASDALHTLRVAVGQDLPLNCPCDNDAPTADAGVDLAATTGVEVELDGSASDDPDGDALTFAWQLVSVPQGSQAVLDDPASAKPSFLPDMVGIYIASLTVSDGDEESAADEVEIDATSAIVVEASPSALLTGPATSVRVVAQIAPLPGLVSDSVRVFAVDENFEPAGDPLCSPLDNGDLDNGDDVGGDNVFSCFVSIQRAQPTVVSLAVQATIDASAVRSGFIVSVVDPLTAQQAQTIASVQQTARNIWEQKSTMLGDTIEARQQTAAAIAALEGVEAAGVSEDGVTVWIRYESGVHGGLMLNPEGSRGAAEGAQWQSGAAAALAGYLPPAFERPAPGPPYRDGFVATGTPAEPPVVESNNVIVWDAYNYQFAPEDEGPELQALFNGALCPKFDVTYLKDAQCDVASVGSFPSYGTIILVTHGIVDGEGKVVFLTSEIASAGSIQSHGVELALGRVAVIGEVFAIRPAFVSSLAGTFDRSIVYAGHCFGSANDTMSNAFFGKGASNFFGFNRVVSSPFARSVSNQLFANLVTSRMDTEEAFAPVTPKVDPDLENATFLRRSKPVAEYTGNLINAGFERGDLTGWSRFGDGRTVSALGLIEPTEGAGMGLVSTGLGFTTTAGTISQSFCLPETAGTLEFDWNFNSEEFHEWCFQGYDDRFVVTLSTAEQSFELLFESIDSLCGEVHATSLHFDQSSPDCIPSTFNDCLVWGTGWLHHAADVSFLALDNGGKGVTLTFAASDIGDSFVDSAVLIDRIEVKPAPAP